MRVATGAALLAAALVSAAATESMAEDRTLPNAGAPAIPSQQPQPPNQAGFLHELKAWWDGSIAFFARRLKDTRGTVQELNKKSGEAAKGVAAAAQQAMKGAVDASKDAATTFVRLPNTRVVDVREHCEPAPNGSPDCVAAATRACRSKRFNGGQPIDVRTAEKCDTAAGAAQTGQNTGKVECRNETTVLRAVCQ